MHEPPFPSAIQAPGACVCVCVCVRETLQGNNVQIRVKGLGFVSVRETVSGLVRVKGLGFVCERETILGLVRVKGLGFMCVRETVVVNMVHEGRSWSRSWSRSGMYDMYIYNRDARNMSLVCTLCVCLRVHAHSVYTVFLSALHTHVLSVYTPYFCPLFTPTPPRL